MKTITKQTKINKYIVIVEILNKDISKFGHAWYQHYIHHQFEVYKINKSYYKLTHPDIIIKECEEVYKINFDFQSGSRELYIHEEDCKIIDINQINKLSKIEFINL